MFFHKFSNIQATAEFILLKPQTSHRQRRIMLRQSLLSPTPFIFEEIWGVLVDQNVLKETFTLTVRVKLWSFTFSKTPGNLKKTGR
jgi:hypothetical protein